MWNEWKLWATYWMCYDKMLNRSLILDYEGEIRSFTCVNNIKYAFNTFFSLLLARLLSSAKEILNMPNKKRGYTWLSSSFMFYALSLFLVALCFCFWSFIRSKQLYDTPFDSNVLPQIVRVNRYWWTLRRKGFFCSYPRKRER